MTIRFNAIQYPRMTAPAVAPPWVCELCPGTERARGSNGHWSTLCTTCEPKFLAAINAHRNKNKPMWFLGRK